MVNFLQKKKERIEPLNVNALYETTGNSASEEIRRIL
jgi:hypothetical protein